MTGELRGIIPRTVEDIFTYIVNDPEPTSKYLVRSVASLDVRSSDRRGRLKNKGSSYGREYQRGFFIQAV